MIIASALVLVCMIAIILGYLFFAPFYIEINSIEGYFRVRFHTIAKVSFKIIDYSPVLEIRIAGWIKQIDLLKTKSKAKEKPAAKKKKKKKKSNIRWRKFAGVLRSFKITQCDIIIDTGNIQLNGILYPVFYLMSFYSKKNIRINFIDENIIVLEIENSIARMSRAYLRS